jgi:hypothetical protein
MFYLLQWWYGPGWLSQWKQLGQKTSSIGQAFSGKTLLKTLFSPWKRVVTANNQNATIQDKFRAFEDNIISRFVGFWVRIFTLIAALVMLVVVGLVYLVLALVWPLLPVISLAAILKSAGLV